MIDVSKIKDEGWNTALKGSLNGASFKKLEEFLSHEKTSHKKLYPPEDKIFQAFYETPLDAVNVVILGQDPYHGEGQAHGLSFSVAKGIKIPPSLRNIYKELERDYKKKSPIDGDLTRWARQGVLLLNTTLTVEDGKPASHKDRGWEDFTDDVIKVLNQQRNNIVFMLWGSHAQKKVEFIDEKKHLVLKSFHPSPLSAHRGFLGCGHFSTANTYLLKYDKKPIEWI